MHADPGSTAHHGNSLDQLGYALHQQQDESDDDQRLGGPLRQAARVARLLVDLDRAHEERAARYDHDDTQRDQEEGMTDDVNPVPHLLLHHVADDVDPDVLVIEQGPRRAEQEHDAEQQPLKLEPGIRGDVEGFPDDRVDRGDDNRHQDQPCQTLAHPFGERVDSPAQFQERLQRRPLPVTPLPPLSAPLGHGGLSCPASMKRSYHPSARSRRQLEVC